MALATTPLQNLPEFSGTQATKDWLSYQAFHELKAADTIISNGIRILEHAKRVELGYQCKEAGIPVDGTIGYTRRRHEAISIMEAKRQVFLRTTIKQLEYAHQVIQLIDNLVSVEEKARWTFANDCSDLFSEETTRFHERLDVILQFNRLKSELYPATAKEAA